MEEVTPDLQAHAAQICAARGMRRKRYGQIPRVLIGQSADEQKAIYTPPTSAHTEPAVSSQTLCAQYL